MTLTGGPPGRERWRQNGSDVTTCLAAGALAVFPLRHPIFEALGHQPTSDYAEQFWLPIVGPSALWAHRRLTTGFASRPAGYTLDVGALGREIGLGAGTGRTAPVIRTLTRLVDFHLAEIVNGRLGVHTNLPPLTRRQAARLPDHLAQRHRTLAQGRGLDHDRAGFALENGR